MRSYAVDELSWPEVGRVLAREPRLLIAAGALEQHGPHLPLGANTLIAREVVTELSRRTGILHAPPFCYGVTTPGGPWPGVTGLRRKTFHRAFNELLARWEDHGVSEFVIVTVHRYEPHVEALLMALTTRSATRVVDLHGIDVSDLLEGDAEREHGGEMETSLVMHLAPHLVRPEEAVDFVPEGRALRRYTGRRMPTAPLGSRGVVGRPSLASGAKGRAVYTRWVERVVEMLGQDPNRQADEG